MAVGGRLDHIAFIVMRRLKGRGTFVKRRLLASGVSEFDPDQRWTL